MSRSSWWRRGRTSRRRRSCARAWVRWCGGARLAAQAIAAGLVDEYQLFIVPAVVGGGTRALPGQVRLDLALAEEHRFGSGTVYLRYHPA